MRGGKGGARPESGGRRGMRDESSWAGGRAKAANCQSRFQFYRTSKKGVLFQGFLSFEALNLVVFVLFFL
jgi:hypothetical protein